MALLLKNGRVFVSGHFETCDVLIEGETIAAVGADLACGEAEVVDCAGKIVVPGLTDMHVHLRDPGQTQKEDILTGCCAAAAWRRFRQRRYTALRATAWTRAPYGKSMKRRDVRNRSHFP